MFGRSLRFPAGAVTLNEALGPSEVGFVWQREVTGDGSVFLVCGLRLLDPAVQLQNVSFI